MLSGILLFLCLQRLLLPVSKYPCEFLFVLHQSEPVNYQTGATRSKLQAV